MTDLTDDQVKALLEGATDGPWRSDDVAVRLEDKSLVALVYGNGRGLFSANARLIAAAPDLARALLDARADAEAAVALALEEAAVMVEGIPDNTLVTPNQRLVFEPVAARIRALAPPAGVAKLAALKAERDEWKAVSETLSKMQAGEYKRAEALAAENASLKARGAGARNAAMLDCVRIVAEERNKQEPGPLFKVLNEAIGKIEDARFAPTKTESPGELVETLRAISMAQSLSVAQQTALKLIKDLGGQND